jgi:hypothetical protein
MFDVSNEYKTSVSSDEKYWTVKCEVSTNKNGEILTTLDKDDFIEDTFKISKQSTSKSSFNIGGVGSKYLTLTLTYKGIKKLKAVNKLIKSTCFKVRQWLKVEDNSQSQDDYSLNLDGSENKTGLVEMGYFYIYDISNSDFNCDLKLYDSMLAFDKDINEKDAIELRDGGSNIYDLLNRFCESCSTDVYKLELEPELEERIINNEYLFYTGSDTTLETYRDAIGWLSILAGGFAEINRKGNLDITSYSNESTLTIEHKNVTEYSVDNNLYEVNKISTSIAGFNYTSISKSTTMGVGHAELYLDENPFLRGIQPEDASALDSKITAIIDNIMTKLTNLKFYGGSFEFTSHPEIDLGDCVTIKTLVLNKDTNETEEVKYDNVLICSDDWTFHTYNSIKCLGYIEVTADTKKSSSFKTASSGGGTTKDTNSVIRTVGTKDKNLKANSYVRLIDILFLLSANIESHLSFTGIASIATSGNIEFKITYDNVEYICRPKWTIANAGYFTFSFDLGLSAVDVDMQHSLKIDAVSTGIVATFAQYDYQAIITASGVSTAEATWTGRYELEDEIPTYTLRRGIIQYVNITDNVDIETSES